MFRKTKIVCTLGPAVDSRAKLSELIGAGMNVARINCSHGSWEARERWVRWVREISAERGEEVAVLLDLQGPKFRLGAVPGGSMRVERGARLPVGEDGLPILQPKVLESLEPGRRILIGDGDVSFRVAECGGGRREVVCLTPGAVRSNQGVTVVGVSFDTPAMTPKDAEDLERGAALGVDFVAVSYLKSAADLTEVAAHVEKADPLIHVVAKIEMKSAVRDIENIVRESDAVMVARGDMGLQMALEDVPLIQKRIIALCHASGKPVITATQMMESMVHSPRPTRAEAADVANAVLDGTDALMLSGETAYGDYPVEAVRTMDRIAVKTERSAAFARSPAAMAAARAGESTEAVARAAVSIAHSLKVKAILSFSTTGFTARMVAKFRPQVPVLCATYRERTARQVSLLWGVRPVLTERFSATEEMLGIGFGAALRRGLLKEGDLVVVTGGIPVGKPGTTNLVTLMRAHMQEVLM